MHYMNDVTLITRTLSIKPARLSIIAEALWYRWHKDPHSERLSLRAYLPYNPTFELALCKFIKQKIQGFHKEIPEIDFKNTTEYTYAHEILIFRIFEVV